MSGAADPQDNAPDVEEGALPTNPDLTLADCKWLLLNNECADKGDAKQRLIQGIEKNEMAPWYEVTCKDLGWPVDAALLTAMKEANTAQLDKLNKAIAFVRENQGESELKDAMVDKAHYLCQIGDKKAAEMAFRETADKTGSVQTKMDVAFSLIRMGMFFNDTDMISRNLEKADALLEQGGDWDRRNRLKVYKATYYVSIRKFAEAATLFLETVSTFTSYELMSYQQFIKLCVLACIISLQRPELKKKVIHGPEIQEVLHELPDLKELLFSFFECRYAQFFLSLATIEGFLGTHRLFSQHRRFYVREMRILAYKQLLQSYKSLTLESMAKSFGVTVDFIDRELSRFVAAGRLNCKIDKVGGVVETNRPDKKNAQYQATIKQGDVLLNNIQKLSQIIHL